MPSTPSSIISSKNARTLLGSAPSKSVVLVVTRKPRFTASLIAFERQVVSAFAADREIVVLVLAVHVDGERQILARLEEVDLFLEQQRVGAEVDVLLARDQAFDDLVDLRMHQRLAAGNGDHRRAALVDRAKALLGREVLLEHVRGILDLAAAGAGQVAAKQRLQHQHQRIALAALDFCFRTYVATVHIWETGTAMRVDLSVPW